MEREKQRERKIKTKRWKDEVTARNSKSSNTFHRSKFVCNMIEYAVTGLYTFDSDINAMP